MKEVSYKEVGFDYDVCDEIYEYGCGKAIEGRSLDVEFLKFVFECGLKFADNKSMKQNINRMIENISKLGGDVLVKF